MIKVENWCCDCENGAYACLGDGCGLRHVKLPYCDHCKEVVDELYWFDGDQLCPDCILKQFDKVEIDD